MGKKLTDQQNLVIALGIAKGEDAWGIAQRAGCSTKTVFNRMDDPAFMRDVETLTSEAIQKIGDRFRGAVLQAFDTITRLSRSAANEGVQLSAARMVLEFAGVQPPKEESTGEQPIFAMRLEDGTYRPIMLLPEGAKLESQMVHTNGARDQKG